MKDLSPVSVIEKFIEYVNTGDIKSISSMIADDILFTDIHGRVYQEKEFMEQYLENYPGYKILAQHLLQGGNGVAIIGKTSGSHVSPEIEEKETLVWTAEITEGLISEWRIYSSVGYAQIS
jgi:hypothetical protein